MSDAFFPVRRSRESSPWPQSQRVRVPRGKQIGWTGGAIPAKDDPALTRELAAQLTDVPVRQPFRNAVSRLARGWFRCNNSMQCETCSVRSFTDVPKNTHDNHGCRSDGEFSRNGWERASYSSNARCRSIVSPLNIDRKKARSQASQHFQYYSRSLIHRRPWSVYPYTKARRRQRPGNRTPPQQSPGNQEPGTSRFRRRAALEKDGLTRSWQKFRPDRSPLRHDESSLVADVTSGGVAKAGSNRG